MSAIGAVGSSTAVTAPAAGSSKASLEAQVATYKKQLSDCVNCPATSSSPEGKEQIQTLSTKISSAEARIQTLTLKESTRVSSAPTTVANTDAATSAQTTGAADQDQSSTPAASGNRINTFA